MNRIILPMLMLGWSLAPVPCQAADPNVEQAKAIAEIVKFNGKVTFDKDTPGKRVIGVDLEHTKFTNAGMKQLKKLHKLQSLNLLGTQITDAGLEELRALPHLHSLDLSFTWISSGGLKHLRDVAPPPITEIGVHLDWRCWSDAS